MPEPVTLAAAVAALKAYAAALAGRPDVNVLTCRIGEPAPAELLAPYRANPNRLPPELLDLYELMNGAEIFWHAPGIGERQGHLHIWPLRANEEMEDSEGDNTYFGPGALTWLFDQQHDAYGTWLVAYGPGGPNPPRPGYYSRDPNESDDAYNDYLETLDTSATRVADARLVFAYTGDDHPGWLLPYTIAEYLLQTVAHDLEGAWPVDDELAREGHPADD